MIYLIIGLILGGICFMKAGLDTFREFMGAMAVFMVLWIWMVLVVAPWLTPIIYPVGFQETIVEENVEMRDIVPDSKVKVMVGEEGCQHWQKQALKEDSFGMYGLLSFLGQDDYYVIMVAETGN